MSDENPLWQRCHTCVRMRYLMCIVMVTLVVFNVSWLHGKVMSVFRANRDYNGPSWTIYLQPLQNKNNATIPLILVWTTFFGQTGYFHQHASKDCGYNCAISDDRRLAENASAIIIHPHDARWDDIPTVRTPSQYYVYYALECPAKPGSKIQGKFDHPSGHPFWNWTMTYRIDSDIWTPYYRYYKQGKNLYSMDISEIRDLVAKKTKPAAWIVSNCNPPSPRNKIYSLLKKTVDISVFGRCHGGSTDCPKTNPRCQERLREYFFFLSFENSICNDYVSEKVWKAVNYKTVPIVLRRRDVEDKLLPGDAFIAVDDFKTVKDLAHHLNSLIKNKTAYTDFYKWRLSGPTGVLGKLSFRNTFMCGLCEKLHTASVKKAYPKLPYGPHECDNAITID